jgi:Resolvase, N terminal domain
VKISKFVKTFNSIQPGDRVVLFARVSTSQQSYRAQLLWLLARVYKRRAKVVWIEECSRSAKLQSGELRRAIAKARRLDAVLVACSLDRFIRPPDFNPKDPSTFDVADSDLERLSKWTKDVPLVAWLDAQASASEVWQHHIKRGKWLRKFDASGDRKPGWQIRRRNKLRKIARGLKRDGFEWDQISEYLNVPKWTLIEWFRPIVDFV